MPASLLDRLTALPPDVSPDEAVRRVGSPWLHLNEDVRPEDYARYKDRHCVLVAPAVWDNELDGYYYVHPKNNRWSCWFDYLSVVNNSYDDFWVCLAEEFEDGSVPEDDPAIELAKTRTRRNS